ATNMMIIAVVVVAKNVTTINFRVWTTASNCLSSLTISSPSVSLVLSSLVDNTSFFFQAEDGIRDKLVTGVQTCALPISRSVTWHGSWSGQPCWESRDEGARLAP